MDFYFKVSAMWVKLKREFYIEFGVLFTTGFFVVEKAFIPHDTNLVF